MDTGSKNIVNEITYWEKVAKTKWGSYITEIEKQAILWANDLAGKPTTALEIGCEGGRWSRLLVERGWDMICTNVDPNTLNICKRRIPTAKHILVSQSDSKIPCETQSIDLLLCIEVSEVIHSNWFINEAFRVLRPSGILVGVITNSLSFRGIAYRLTAWIDSKRKKYGYLPYKLSYGKWKKRLFQSGFEVVYEVGFCWFPFLRSSDFFLIPLFTQIEQHLGLRRLTSLSPWIVFVAKKI